MKSIDPKKYGLSSRDRIEPITESHWALVLDRKSRIIMVDGKRILKKVQKIQQHEPHMTVTIQTNAPVCSKTQSFLSKNGIKIESII